MSLSKSSSLVLSTSRTYLSRRLISLRSIHTQNPKSAASISAAVNEEINTTIASNSRRVETFMSPYYNTSTSLSPALREKMGLTAQVPAAVETFKDQASRALSMVRSKTSPLEKYMFMAQLRNNNTRLFYKLINDHIEEFAPIIYTPTVGEACQKYSHIYPFLSTPGTPDGLYITLADLDRLDELIESYKERTSDTPDITVITDGSRILGLGDLGMNGMPISMGKLQLYVAGAGIDPRRTLPIVLDFGTNNETNLNDPLYLGVREKRPQDKQFYSAVERVLGALTRAFPDMLVQFEDFSSEHAFGLLEQYRDKILCFNDDIQGTGAVILSGLINAFKKVQAESNLLLRDHRIVFYGAGSAAIGVAKQIQDYLQTEHGLSEQEARDVFYVCDSKGLVTADRGDRLADHKVYYARRDNQGAQYKTLEAVVDHVRPTTLIGLSSSSGAFNDDVLRRMGKINKRPIVFPLSNPSTKAECTFADAMKATGNSVLFASGTAFPPYTVPETKEVRVPGQGNNMYMFPGLGLGAILARPEHISNRIILRASIALADSLTEEERGKGLLYPELTRIKEVSATVAAAVCDQAVRDGIATAHDIKTVEPNNYVEFVKSRMWSF